MATLLMRPALAARPDEPASLLRGWLAAIVAALWAAATLLLPLCVLGFLGWVSDRGSSSIAGAIRIGAEFWIAGHGVPIDTPSGLLTLHPLGVTLAIAVLLWRAGAWAGASSHVPTAWSMVRLLGVVVVVYTGLVTGVAILAATPAARMDRWAALAGAAVLSSLAGGVGLVHGAGRVGALRRHAPGWLRVGLDTGAGATLVLLGGGAVVLAAALTFHGGTVVRLTDALDAGPVGGLLLLLVGIALVPNAAIFAMSYAVGPGFSLGAGSSVSIAGAHVGAVPALPLLGALPSGLTPPAYAYAAIALPGIAGIVAGVLAIRRSRGVSAEVAALRGLCAGPVAGTAVLALTWASRGGFGSGRLGDVGPSPLLVGLVVTAEVGVLAAVTAWVGCPRTAGALSASSVPNVVMAQRGPVLPTPPATTAGGFTLAPRERPAPQPGVPATDGDGDDTDTQVDLRRAL